MNAIEFKNVWERYRVKYIKKGEVSWEKFWALEDTSFEVKKGEVLGIVGQNGAGKTTLLKLIAGMLVPDKGKVVANGKISVLMELGAGFNPEFTGIENIIFNAQTYGFREEELNRRTEEIIEFTGLGKFIYAPIKYYSQGMYMRLAFALAIFVEPDILLIDDILAVGDEEAQQKCTGKIFGLKKAGKTIVLVSHDMNMISKLCDRAILLEKGKIVQEGLPQKVIPRYLETVGNKKGIITLTKGKLRVVFNNGAMILSYEDITLTKGMSGYLSFLLPTLNFWSSSFNLDWRIRTPVANEVVADGVNEDGTISLIWKIQIQENKLYWNIKARGGLIKEPHIDLFLAPEYEKWISLQKEGDFGFFVHKSNWHQVSFGNRRDNMIGVGKKSEEDNLPFLVLEIGEKDSQFRLSNTGYEQEARIIQLPLINNTISLKIDFFSDIVMFRNYIDHARKQFLLKQQEELRRLRDSSTISSDTFRLFADVENKAIRLYYKDREITKGSGLHSSFLLDDIWYDLSSCNWQVKKENGILILHLYWEKRKFTQTWNLFIKEDCLIWQVDAESDQPVEYSVLKFGFFLVPEYKSFFCGHQESDFPKEFTFWQDMTLEEPKAELFGVRKKNNLPAVVLENKQGCYCIVQNSDIQSSCYALQLSLHKQDVIQKKSSFFTKLRLFEEENPVFTYLEKEKEKRFLEQQDKFKYLRDSRTISSANFSLFADIENKTIRFYYKDKEITEKSGLYSLFCVSDNWFHLRDAQWQVEKISQDKLVLISHYEFLPLSQIWEFIFKEENSLMVEIKMEINNPMSISSQDVRLELKDKYRSWKTTSEQGEFLVSRYISNICPIRLRDNKISKIVLVPGSKRDIPKLFFSALSHLGKRIFSIYKGKGKSEEYLCLASSLIIPKKEMLVNPGKHIYFEGEVILDGDIKLEEDSALEGIVGLSRGSLKFIFDRGRGKILWREKELTAGLCMYTSVRHLGIWYDSYQASWQLSRKDGSKMVISGYWPHIPISQTWQIEVVDKNLIFWKADLEIYEEVVLEIEQANLMLSSEYRFWVIPEVNQGRFLDEYTQDYDILPFRFWYGKAKEIAGEAETLPRIIFKSCTKNSNSKAIVENTDSLYSARLLQYQKANIYKLLPGRYSYFEGVIEIESKE